jgi:hypothetical protein
MAHSNFAARGQCIAQFYQRHSRVKANGTGQLSSSIETGGTPETEGSMTDIYLIWSNEHTAWWRPDRCGYTYSITDAGRYQREEALRICSGANYGFIQDYTGPNEIPVLLADALETMNAKPPEAAKGMKIKRMQRYG